MFDTTLHQQLLINTTISKLNNIRVLAEVAHYWAAQQDLQATQVALTLTKDKER